MGDKTKIEWCDATINPIRGCTRVSEGCRNCYAERQAVRLAGEGKPYEGLVQSAAGGPRWTGRLRYFPEELDKPLRWKRPRKIFVCSMSDLFHEQVEEEWLWEVTSAMLTAQRHTFMVLTKRPERMREWALELLGEGDGSLLSNLWLGVSAEDQAAAEERIPYLLELPAAVRWVSAEPLLGPLDLSGYMYAGSQDYLDWVVCGGESGPKARPMHPDWARGLRDQCLLARVPFFFKQWGECLPSSQAGQADRARWRSCKKLYQDTDFKGVRAYTDLPRGHERILEHWGRVGKKAAGRLLDGREWSDFPEYSGGNLC